MVPGLRNARSGGLDSHYGSGSGGGEQDPAAAKGKGPRIYVGGIPTAVSETMVRGHFNQWGQVGRTATCILAVLRGKLWSKAVQCILFSLHKFCSTVPNAVATVFADSLCPRSPMMCHYQLQEVSGYWGLSRRPLFT